MPPDHLVLLAEGAHHLLQGAAYVQVAPLLDGRWSDDEIHTYLEQDGVPPLPARLALAHLRALGLVHERPADGQEVVRAGATPEVVAFWDALGEDPGAVSARVARSRVAIRDGGGAGAAAFRRALEAAGLTTVEDQGPSDLTVAVANDLFDARLDAINRTALDGGGAWMVVRLVGTVPWIGPLFVPGKTGCLACLTHRLRLNRQTEQFLEARFGASARVPLPSTSWSVALAAEVAAVEVLRWIATGRHDRLVGGVLALDLKTNALVHHPLTRRPQCRACGQAPRHDAVPRSAVPVVLGPSPKRELAGGRSESAGDVLARLAHHVSPITGVVRALSESNEHGYLHVAASQAFPMHRYDFRVLRDNLVGRSGGKGFDPTEARAGALCEALERYSGSWQGEEEWVVTASRHELGDEALDLGTLLGFSDRQYAEREAWNAASDEPHAWVPKRLDDELVVDWVPAWSLTRGRSRLVPAAYSYYGHPDLRHMFCSSDSNGCAAGGTLTEAVAHGLLELIERDAAAIWWYNRAPRPAVDLDGFALPLVREFRELYQGQGRTFWALDLTTDLGVPVVAAVSARVDDPVEDVIYGFAADFDPGAAVHKALLEMNQSLFSVFRPARGQPAGRYRTDQPAARRWFQSATRASQPYLAPAPGAPPRTREDFGWAPQADWRDDLAQCVERLRESGLELFVLDQTRPDIGLPVSRVVVPGLCHFWHRLGTPRLYDVPVRLGWRDAPCAEGDLNPWFIYF